jgi:predicted oxidoreductase
VVGADPDFGPPQRYDFRYEHLIKSVETSLRRLATDRIDLLALHRPDPLVEYEEVARAFDQLHASGKVRYFGVSNHTANQIALLQHHIQQPIVLNQLELSLLHPTLISAGILANMDGFPYPNTAGLLDFCRLHQILVQAWSPTAGGKVFASQPDATKEQRRLARQVAVVARAHKTTDEAIVLAWLLRHPAGIQPILGTSNTDRIGTSVRADEIVLSRAQWYTLLEAARGEPVP